MRTLKLTLAYDGTAYAGWQLQPGKVTLQGALEATLLRITGQPTRVAASGRTDAGVHALAQVVSFQTASDLSLDVLQSALNAELPRDMAALALCEAPPGFHARRDAVRKRYRYVIYNRKWADVFRRRHSWHFYRRPLDAAAMDRAAKALLGTHDFRSFETRSPQRATTVRTIYDIFVARGSDGDADVLTIEVEADGFLYNMVRSIVGTLVEVGRGAQSESWPADVVLAGDRRAAGMTVPPQGLFLVHVRYEE
jgi:tRNA pseudouridine38-40 synthase